MRCQWSQESGLLTENSSCNSRFAALTWNHESAMKIRPIDEQDAMQTELRKQKKVGKMWNYDIKLWWWWHTLCMIRALFQFLRCGRSFSSSSQIIRLLIFTVGKLRWCKMDWIFAAMILLMMQFKLQLIFHAI